MSAPVTHEHILANGRLAWLLRQIAFPWSPPVDAMAATLLRRKPVMRRRRVVTAAPPAPPSQLDLLAWKNPRLFPIRLRDGRMVGGPDPAAPCSGCPSRRGCTALCELVEPIAGLAPEEIVESREVSSPALMEGRGYDEAFYVLHPALVVADTDLWGRLVRRYGPVLRRLANGTEPGLTWRQREMLSMMLFQGLERRNITALRGKSRQSSHKVFHAMMRVLRAHLGDLPESLQRSRG